MTHRSTLLALAALLFLGACATATPYQAASTSGARGYVDQQIESNRWQVSFSGNSLTERQTVETYLLYRAAELTIQQGYDFFQVAHKQTEADTTVMPTGFGYDPFYSGFYCRYRVYGRSGLLRRAPLWSRWSHAHRWPHAHLSGRRTAFYDPFWDGYDYREIIRYEASAEILMGQGTKPEGKAFFNAAEVLENLSGQIVRPDLNAPNSL